MSGRASTPRPRRAIVTLAVALTAALATAPAAVGQTPTPDRAAPAAPTAAGSASTTGTGRSPSTVPAPPAAPGRLEAAAETLRDGALHVEDELSWMLDAEQERALRRDLEAARVPVLVAFLPSLAEDESGGDTRRVLRALQEQVGRDAVYVTVDDDGRFDLASMGVPLNLGISYSLLSPPRDERPYEQQDADPGPPGWRSVPDRLREIVEHVRVAEAGTPNGPIERIRPLRTLPGHHGPANGTGDVVAAGVLGLVFGLIAAGVVLAIGRARRPSPSTSSPTPRRKGQRRA